MARPGWYMMAYDITDPKRLAKVYRILKKEGILVQKSVFFVKGTEQRIEKLLDRLATVIRAREDDIRAYPVTHPRDVWTTGGPLSSFPLVQPGGGKTGSRAKKTPQGKKSWKQKVAAWFAFGKK